MIIAIDGPAGSGKSTVALIVAKKLGGTYISTGNMYRAITLAILKGKFQIENAKPGKIAKFLTSIELKYLSETSFDKIILNGEDVSSQIRSPEVASLVSRVSAIPEIRKWLVEKQRQIAENTKIAIMEGRDIGTVVFPDAKWKFFIIASPEVRAKRRLLQSGENFEGSTLESVARQIAERDRMDMTRKVAPLTKADDAVLIDSSEISAEDVANKIVDMVKNEV